MSENEEPDWLAELARGGEALQREAIRLVKTAEELATHGPARPFIRRIVRAVGAGIRELGAPEPVVHTVSGTASMTGVGTITAVGSIMLPKMQVYGEGTVRQPDLIERNIGRILAPDLIERNIGRIFALVLLAAATAGLLGVHAQDQATVGYYAGVIFGALSLAFAIWAGHK